MPVVANVVDCTKIGKLNCADGLQCYDASETCDLANDCIDGTDEKNCSKLPAVPTVQFICMRVGRRCI